ncbi:MAG: alpha-ketoglutarate-dependent dioxygenase AlkB [Pyrinomonadaceae bacterium]
MPSPSKTVRSTDPPDGFRYETDILSREEELELARQIRELPLKEFEFHGYLGKRRVISYGWHYDFGTYSIRETEALPEFLNVAREKAAKFSGLSVSDLSHALITEYRPGTTIGWHRDRAVFGDVIGMSLLSECTFRFRRKSGSKWERHSLTLQPRSAYLLRGAARNDWEHSIPAVGATRYSITFRSLRDGVLR